ncbi:ABC transporter ATP-binding protein [Kribbella jiaozuonensis]|uniref:ATP-binding cassette domain-containing protein n=1 Tax=Kribbella jiaozuonensis TaxID=2575441 RepID=A0A4U3LIY8_9ACTN|nr:ATP-binding cassette domain-containing protein [Kribbella jiaozuonensis]TKK75510.1 ATP-binding cassette domain-containing protein [Kribbella jiaozuonensis]
MTAVQVENLSMSYKAPVRKGGLRAALGSLVKREYKTVQALDQVSFTIAPGQVSGFIGPNGAGKTTTMKILSGILHPTSGEVRVLDMIPWQRRSAFLKRIAFLRGSQPVGGSQELTVMDSLEYQRLLYDVPRATFRSTLTDLEALLDLEPLLERQLRALSLGERMRVGLAMALIYRPEVLFLDEPTIGLDVSAASQIREFVSEYVEQTGATVLLTSHYMADVASLCPRLILIDHGKVQYDGPLAELSARLSPYKLIRVSTQGDPTAFGEVIEKADGQWVLRVPRDEVAATTGRLLQAMEVVDLAVEEPPLEKVIDQAYREGLR